MCTDYHPLSVNDPQGHQPARAGAWTRRGFLQTGLSMMATASTVPAFLSNTGEALAQSAPRGAVNTPGVPDERVLVVVQLSGGNDGLNTVAPVGSRAYYNARRSIAIAEGQALMVDSRGIGLHPQLGEVHELIADRRGAVVQGVGYPNPNRSHFASMDIWHTADPSGGRGAGWIGKAFDAQSQAGDSGSMGCISIGNEAPLAAHGESFKPVAFESADLFRWTAEDIHPAVAETYRELQQAEVASAEPVALPGGGTLPMGPEAATDATAFVQRTAMDAQVASMKVRRAVSAEPRTRFPGHGLARQLRSVAAMIHAELPTRVYYVSMGGFDTHANQQGRHFQLMRQFSESVGAFQAELEATGHADRVVTVAFSEFGRRVAQNASGGTDHGAAGPVFVFGPQMPQRLVGAHPSLTDLDRGDLKYKIDFRQVYAELLDNWLELDSMAALGQRYRHPGIFSA
ncbi:MAG: DUF1501 domain-containing protein [Planctomycetota bacterium]